MILFSETIRCIFLMSGLLLLASCVIAANRMSSATCGCQKGCLIMIIIGATFQMGLGGYGYMTILGMLASVPISIGVAFKLLLDKRTYCSNSIFDVLG